MVTSAASPTGLLRRSTPPRAVTGAGLLPAPKLGTAGKLAGQFPKPSPAQAPPEASRGGRSDALACPPLTARIYRYERGWNAVWAPRVKFALRGGTVFTGMLPLLPPPSPAARA